MVDSGLPNFCGPRGNWTAYPSVRGNEFSDLSTPHWFKTDPTSSWGFFGHRLAALGKRWEQKAMQLREEAKRINFLHFEAALERVRPGSEHERVYPCPELRTRCTSL